LVLELSWRKDGWHLLLVNVISKTAKLVLNLPEMIMNALIVTLSVARQPVKILKKSVDVICDNYAGPLRWYGHQVGAGRWDTTTRATYATVTLALAVGIDSNLGKGAYAGEICGVT
jgi:hypothetical protein